MKRSGLYGTAEGLSRGAVIAAHDFLFLKATVAVAAVAALAYLWHSPAGGPAGDTWLGYTLGIASASQVLWLAYFGIRKRRYAGGRVDLRTWLAAHIYLGILVVVLATLHSGFRIGSNLHGLTWLLLVLTVCSGIFGLQAYIRYPRLISGNRAGIAFDTLLAQIADLDSEMRTAVMLMGDDLSQGIHAVAQTTAVGGNIWQRLGGRIPDCPTTRMRQQIETRLHAPDADASAPLRHLLGLLTRKESLLSRARRELQLLAWLQVWLFVHIPLSCGLLAAIAAHVVAVLFLR